MHDMSINNLDYKFHLLFYATVLFSNLTFNTIEMIYKLIAYVSSVVYISIKSLGLPELIAGIININHIKAEQPPIIKNKRLNLFVKLMNKIFYLSLLP